MTMTNESVISVIEDARQERGIPVAELARRTEIDAELLRRTLSGGRNLKAVEYIAICRELCISFDDFAEIA